MTATTRPRARRQRSTPDVYQFHRDATRHAYALEHIATLGPQALEHLDNEIRILDGYPTRTPGASTTTGPTRPNTCTHCHGKGCDHCWPVDMTAVERQAARRHTLNANRAQTIDDLHAIGELAQSLTRVLNAIIGYRVPDNAKHPCDGSNYEGADLEWIPGNRHIDNGWYDPACADEAETGGLCGRCRIRCRRWRDKHGLRPLAHDDEAAA